jgi:hypothetical protein
LNLQRSREMEKAEWHNVRAAYVQIAYGSRGKSAMPGVVIVNNSIPLPLAVLAVSLIFVHTRVPGTAQRMLIEKIKGRGLLWQE